MPTAGGEQPGWKGSVGTGHATAPHICKLAAWLLHYSQHPPPKTAIAWNSSSAAAIALQRTVPGAQVRQNARSPLCAAPALAQRACVGMSWCQLHASCDGGLGGHARLHAEAVMKCHVKRPALLNRPAEVSQQSATQTSVWKNLWLHAQLTTPPPPWRAWGVPSPWGTAATGGSAVSSPPCP